MPGFVAAYRDISIGSDTKGYVYGLFKLATETNEIKNYCFLSKAWWNVSDFLYITFTYFIAHLFNGSFKIFLFLIEEVIIIPIFIALDKSKKNRNEVLLGMLIFYCFMYNVTFNMARQSIALAFSILGLYYLQNNKNVKAILFLIISIGFHKTAMISIMIYFIYWIYLLLEKKSHKKSNMFFICIYIISIISVIFYKNVIYFLANIGIYKNGIEYLQKYSKFDFSFIDTFLYLFMIFVFIKNKKILKEKNVDFAFFQFLGIESLILLQFGAFVQYAERFSFYFFYPFILYGIPKIVISNEQKERIGYLSLILFLIAYWVFMFVILGVHNTVPYVFAS